MDIRLKRAYDDAANSDGTRILVDRLWPRGLSKERARLDLWLKEIAPTTELRKWFNHDPAKWHDFCQRYTQELDNNSAATEQLLTLARAGRITLVYGARDEAHNDAIVLKDYLEARAAHG